MLSRPLLMPLSDRADIDLPVTFDEVARSHPSTARRGQRTLTMLMTVAILLVLLWAVGLVTSSTMGGAIHILLVLAIVIILVRLIQGRRVV